MKKILIVDNDEAIHPLYNKTLRAEGYDVVLRADAFGLLQIIDEENPDLILLDVQMKKHNGLDLLIDIRSLNHTMPIIIYSSEPQFKYDIRAALADYYVIKNPDLDELILIVRIALKDGRQFISGLKLEALKEMILMEEEIKTGRSLFQ